MTHSEFVAAYARGEIRAEFDSQAAGRFLSARLFLPFVMMPAIGAGVALALIGWIYTGLAVIALAFIAPRLIKRSAPGFLLQNVLRDADLYEELTQSGVLRVLDPAADERTSATSEQLADRHSREDGNPGNSMRNGSPPTRG